MTHRNTISKLFTAAALAFTMSLGAGCLSDEPDEPTTDPQLVAQPDDEEAQLLCAAACDVLVGPCSEQAATSDDADPFGDDVRALAACRSDCLAGAFTADELACFADTACGAPADSCFE